MEKKIQQQIVDYFTHLDSIYKNVKLKLVECQKGAVKIYHLRERLKKLQMAELSLTPLDKFNGLIDKIHFHIITAISDNLELLRIISQEFDKMRDNLINKKQALDKSCSEIDFSSSNQLVDGSALQPRLCNLMEFSLDGVTFINCVCSQIQNAMFNFSTNEYSATQFNEAFKIDPDIKKTVEEIIMLTQFSNKNEIL